MPEDDTPQHDLTGLEASIRQVDGVLGCVILLNPTRAAYEIHAFTRTGVDSGAVEVAIAERAEAHPLKESLSRIFLFELDAGSDPQDRDLLRRAAEPGPEPQQPTSMHFPRAARRDRRAMPAGKRPLLVEVSLAPSIGRSIARVALEQGARRVTGEATGELTAQGLEFLADATLDAVANLLRSGAFRCAGASLVEVAGESVVVVVVGEDDGLQLVGAALVRAGSVTETAVRATLDAVNRRLEREA
jgi:hypothetical protein